MNRTLWLGAWILTALLSADSARASCSCPGVPSRRPGQTRSCTVNGQTCSCTAYARQGQPTASVESVPPIAVEERCSISAPGQRRSNPSSPSPTPSGSAGYGNPAEMLNCSLKGVGVFAKDGKCYRNETQADTSRGCGAPIAGACAPGCVVQGGSCYHTKIVAVVVD
jgi:hypothetical protein